MEVWTGAGLVQALGPEVGVASSSGATTMSGTRTGPSGPLPGERTKGPLIVKATIEKSNTDRRSDFRRSADFKPKIRKHLGYLCQFQRQKASLVGEQLAAALYIVGTCAPESNDAKERR